MRAHQISLLWAGSILSFQINPSSQFIFFKNNAERFWNIHNQNQQIIKHKPELHSVQEYLSHFRNSKTIPLLAPETLEGSLGSEEILSLIGKDISPQRVVDNLHNWWRSKPVDTSMVPVTARRTKTGIYFSYDIAPDQGLLLEVHNYASDGSELSVIRKSPGMYSLGTQIEGLLKNMETQIIESILLKLGPLLPDSTISKEVDIDGQHVIDVTDKKEQSHKTFQTQTKKQPKASSKDFMDQQTKEEKQMFDTEVEQMFQNYFDAQEERGFKGVVKQEDSERKEEGKQELDELFQLGATLATQKTTQSKIKTKSPAQEEEEEFHVTTEPLGAKIEKDLAEFSVMLGDGLQGGIDIFHGPLRTSSQNAYLDEQVASDPPDVQTLHEDDLTDVQKEELQNQRMKFTVLVRECVSAPDDLFMQIANEYKDALLSPFYVAVMREQLSQAQSEREHDVLGKINQYAMTLIQEMTMMMEMMETQQLEKIRDICQTAMEDMSKLPTKVKNMKFLLDKDFIGYLKHAIGEERLKIRNSGMNPDREPTDWLQVLLIIKKGVYAELQKDISEEVDMVSHIVRLNTPEQRKMLLERFIDTMATMDVRKFKKVITNIVDNFALRKDQDQQLMERVAELGVNIEKVLPESRIQAIMAPVEDAAERLLRETSFLSESKDPAGKGGLLHGLESDQVPMPGHPPLGQHGLINDFINDELEREAEAKAGVEAEDEDDAPMFREGIMDMLPVTQSEIVDLEDLLDEDDYY